MEKIRVSHNRKLICGLVLIAVFVITACSADQPAVTPGEPSGTSAQGTEQLITQPVPDEVPTEIIPSPEQEDSPAPTAVEKEMEVEDDPGMEGYPAPGYQVPTNTPALQPEPYPSPQESIPPPVKTELEATDPSMVNLASGEPQLLEFFAFW